MKAEKGDLIRVIKKHPKVETFEVGGIYEVVGYSSEGADNEQVVILGIDGEDGYVDHNEYVIHRKAGEEEETEGCDMCSGDPERADCPYCATEEKTQDVVNSPNHYMQGRFETIEIIEEITKGYEDGYVAYCVGNALKYLARAPFKHGEPTEDLAKAERYLAFANAYLTQSTE